jgi:hypothetical protein
MVSVVTSPPQLAYKGVCLLSRIASCVVSTEAMAGGPLVAAVVLPPAVVGRS